MDDSSTIARPYAQAALAQAKEEGKLSEWSDMLAFLAAALADPQMKGIIANPRVEGERLTEFVLQVCEGRLTDTGVNFVRVLVANRRLGAVAQIAAQFEAARAEFEGRRHIDVTSAFELDEGQRAAVAEAISKKLGREVDLTVSVDSNLIGGVVIRAGDLVIDASMRGQLRSLAHSLGAAA